MKRLLFIFLILNSAISFSQVDLKDNEDSLFTKFELSSYALQDLTKKVRIWGDYIEIKPNDFRGYFRRGFYYESLKYYDSAIQDYSKVIELRKKNNTVSSSDYTFRAYVLLKNGSYVEAMSDISKAIILNSQDDYSYSLRADIKIALLDYRGAIEDLKLAIDIAQKDPLLINALPIEKEYISDWISTIGTCKANLNDFQGAVDEYNNAIKWNPNHSYSFYSRGKVLIRLGEKDRGCLDLSKAGELGYKEAYIAIKMYCQ